MKCGEEKKIVKGKVIHESQDTHDNSRLLWLKSGGRLQNGTLFIDLFPGPRVNC